MRTGGSLALNDQNNKKYLNSINEEKSNFMQYT